MTNIKYNEIKTANSIKEFRDNLKKYFVCVPTTKSLGKKRELVFSERDHLYVLVNDILELIDINTIESLSDLFYKVKNKTRTGSHFDFEQDIRITPTINFSVQDVLVKDKSE